MKKFLHIFFMTLGVLFFCIILAGTYFFITDPYNLKPLIFGTSETPESVDTDATSDHPLLNKQQEEVLETFGIDPTTVPTEITPEQEACFEDRLGKDRVAEIKAGSAPTATEFFTARDCI